MIFVRLESTLVLVPKENHIYLIIVLAGVLVNIYWFRKEYDYQERDNIYSILLLLFCSSETLGPLVNILLLFWPDSWGKDLNGEVNSQFIYKQLEPYFLLCQSYYRISMHHMPMDSFRLI